MVGLSDLVSSSLARHGVTTRLDPRRLQWSKWFPCEDPRSILFVPGKPGIFAVAREILEESGPEGRRMLALSLIAETADLGMALGRMLLPGSPEQEFLTGGRCFVRYAVIEEDQQRESAHQTLLRWMSASAEAAAGLASQDSTWDAPEPESAGTAA